MLRIDVFRNLLLFYDISSADILTHVAVFAQACIYYGMFFFHVYCAVGAVSYAVFAGNAGRVAYSRLVGIIIRAHTGHKLGSFVRKWSQTEKKEAIRQELKSHGIDLDQLKKDQHMEAVDDFDFITHVAYDQKPLTRRERAENVKKRDFLHKYSGVARQVIEALLEKYANDGITEIERTEVLRLDPFRRIGNPARIAKLFGGKEGYLKAVKELEEEIYRIG